MSSGSTTSSSAGGAGNTSGSSSASSSSVESFSSIEDRGGPLTVFCSGANRGIGFEIVKTLAARSDTLVFLGSRDKKAGKDAAKAMPTADGSEVVVVALEVTADKEALAAAAATVKKKAKKWWKARGETGRNSKTGLLDVLINNAAVAGGSYSLDEELAQRLLDINYYGATLAVTSAFFDLITRQTGRIINVASRSGRRSRISKKLQRKYSADDATPEDINALLDGWIGAVATGRAKKKGYTDAGAYSMSKLAQIAYTRAFARSDDIAASGVTVHAMCPGWVATDMGGSSAPKTPAQGADTAIWLATSADRPANGEFYGERSVIEW